MVEPRPLKKHRTDGTPTGVSMMQSAMDVTMEEAVERFEANDPRRQRLLPHVPLSLPYTGGKFFYVRECYSDYYTLVESVLATARQGCCVTLTGTPGIGVSVFYAYFAARYLDAHPEVWIIATSHFNDEELTEVAVFRAKDTEPSIHVRGDMAAAIDNAVKEARRAQKNVLFLCDGLPKRPRADGQMVVFTNPHEHWLETVKYLEGTFYMPLWTLQELQAAARVLGLPLSRVEIEERFGLFGGAARYCLNPNQDDVELAEHEIGRAIRCITNVETLQRLLVGTETTTTRHRLVCYAPRESNRMIADTKFASPGIETMLADYIASRSTLFDRAMLRQWLRVEPHAAPLRGRLMETETHKALAQRRRLRLRPLVDATTTADEEEITVHFEETENQRAEFESVTPSIVARGPYHKPKSTTLGFYLHKMTQVAADGQSLTARDVVAWNAENRLWIFQTTVPDYVDASGMIHVIQSLGLLESVAADPTRVALVFVVPSEAAARFKRQKIITQQGTTTTTISRTAADASGGNVSELMASIPQYVCSWETLV